MERAWLGAQLLANAGSAPISFRPGATIRKKYVFEGAIRIQQDLTVLAGNLFKRRHQSVKIPG
jgi:hypothetical protein